MKAWTEQQRQKERSCKNCIIQMTLAAVSIFVVAVCMYELKSLQDAADPQQRATLFGDPNRFLAHKQPAEGRRKWKANADNSASHEEGRARAHIKEEILRNHGKNRGNRNKAAVNESIHTWLFV